MLLRFGAAGRLHCPRHQNNVMIFGESGGGAKTSCLYAMPSAEPFFNKASIESGPGIRMMPKEAAAETAVMTLKQLGLAKDDWRKLLDVPAAKLLEAQVELGKQPGAGPLTMSGGRKGMGGNARPGGFGPMVDGTILPHHPFDPVAPAISKDKPLIVGTNRDETNFFFMQSQNTGVFELTYDTLEQRLQKEFDTNADLVFDTYRKSRPGASAPDLYTAISTADDGSRRDHHCGAQIRTAWGAGIQVHIRARVRGDHPRNTAQTGRRARDRDPL